VEDELPLKDPGSPIPNLGVVDVNTVKVGGGSDLFIIVATPLQAEPYSLKRLLRKVEAYLEFIKSDVFIKESGFATPDNTRIVVKLHPDSAPVARTLLECNVQWVLNNDATLVIETLTEHLPLQ
jgi:hypothetical protein